MTALNVVITGASAGIGAACAREFAKQGCRLFLGARRTDRLKELLDSLAPQNEQEHRYHQLDVTDEQSIQNFVDHALSAFNNRIDVLINNAGLAVGVDPIAAGKPEDWELMLQTNIMGVLRVTRLILPNMIAKHSGHVINLGSIAGHYTYAGGAVYAGTKHALKAITGALRLELCGSNVRISSIDPGMVETEFSEVRLQNKKQADAVYQGMTPLNGKDIAACAWFIASRPAHVNIDHLIVMPTDQASVYKVHRQ